MGLFLCCNGDILGQETAPPRPPDDYQLTLAGNDRVLWLMAGRRVLEETGSPDWVWYQRLAYQDRQMNKMAEALVDEQVGRVRLATVVGERLHVFFDDGSHYRYAPARANRELQLPDRTLPMAIAGQGEGVPPRLWAVVPAATADEIERVWLAERAAARRSDRNLGFSQSRPETESSPVEADPPAAREPGSYHLVSYAEGQWQPISMTPGACAASERFWLACRGDNIHLFWQVKAGNRTIHHAVYSEGKWRPVSTFHLRHLLESACCFVTNTQLYFAVVQQDPTNVSARLVEYWVCSSDPENIERETWITQPALRLGEQELRLSAGTAVGGFANQLVICRWEEGAPQIGYWPITGGAGIRDFATVLGTRRETLSPRRQSLKELIATMAVMLMLLLIWWRRQQSIAVPIELPPGLGLAYPHKRLAAALIDMIPAAAVVLVHWWAPLHECWHQVQQLSREDIGGLPMSKDIWWAGIWFRVLYASYGLLCEAILKATPGKLLLGCRVSTETLEPPGLAQIAIRNITKLVELEPTLIALPMLIVFTRNRQRLGDLIARTVVVERYFDQPMPPSSSDSEDQDGDR